MVKVRFYDLLGVTTDADAAAMWPSNRIKSSRGFVLNSDPTELVRYLQSALECQNLRAGSDAASSVDTAQIGINAEISIKNPPGSRVPLVFTQMPDIEFYLQDTQQDKPARLYATSSETGVEIIVEGLPVEIRLPSKILSLENMEEIHESAAGFSSGVYDSFEVKVTDMENTSIFVHIKVRMTEEREFVIEPAVPLSIGPCRLGGVPCRALYDLNFIPSLKLQSEQALEWTRHSIDHLTVNSTYSGAITVRTIDLDNTRPPLEDLANIFNENNGPGVEFVLEDVAIPFFNLTGLPIPSHGQFGLRRRIEYGDSQEEAFSLYGAPAKIDLGDWTLLIDQLFLQTPASLSDQFIFLQMALLHGETKENSWPLTIGVTDEWTVQAGMKRVSGLHLFTIADAAVNLWGFKLGWSIRRFASEDPITNKPYSLGDQIQILADIGVTTKGTSIGLFKMRSLSGKDLEFVLRDVGWNLGGISLEGLRFPEGVQLLFGNTIRLIAEEIGWITENNGGRYFSFTGGVEGLTVLRGIQFHRLRFKTGGSTGAPPWLLDGLTLSVQLGRLSIEGFGMVNEFSLAGHEYKEMGFGARLRFTAIGKDFLIGSQFFQGEVRGPVDNFTYWMFGFQFSPIPLGAFELVNVRLLLAGNMTPNLSPPDGYAQNMRLFRWYKATGPDALAILSNRKLTGWKRVDDSFAAGLGAGLSLPIGKIIRFDSFLFFYKSPEDSGLMLALEAYILAGKSPVGYGVLEFDFDQERWGFMMGVNFGIDSVLGFSIPLFSDVFTLSGTLYAGNKPGTFAIGQLNDQSTWLSVRLDVDAFVQLHVYAGFCVQLVDRPGGPRGFGFVIAGKGGADFGIGSVQVYATFGMIAGVWKNESNVQGFKMWMEAALRIKVFWIFDFGASIRIEFDYLGPDPLYRRLGFEIEIGLPFPFPDVTFRFERIWGQSEPSNLKIISTPVISSDGIDPFSRYQHKLAATPLTGTSINEQELYTMNQLRALEEPSTPPAVYEQMSEIGIDSMIAVNFKPPVDDLLRVGEFVIGPGTQSSLPPAINDLKATYQLVEVGIRRRPRFGPNAGVWSTLLAPENTRIGNLSDLEGNSGMEARFASKITFQWDRDLLWRRLLINASTPYTFLTSNQDADIVRTACCRSIDPEMILAFGIHEITFRDVPIGTRVPSYQLFTRSNSTLHWLPSKTPVVVPPSVAPTAWPAVARIPIQGEEMLAILSFDEPISHFWLYSYWFPLTTALNLVVEAYNGLRLLDRRSITMRQANRAPIHFENTEGITSILLRLEREEPTVDVSTAFTSGNFLEILRLSYVTVRQMLWIRAHNMQCRARQQRALGSGKFSWLPNHDYEITVTTDVIQDHATTGPQQATVKQKTFFRTKGIIGLNAVARIGDELEGYVESRYPAPVLPLLYRSESIALVFNEQFNILLPVDRAPSPDNPDELNQILEWVLTVRKEGGVTGLGEQISKTALDWIITHRNPALPEVSQLSVLANSVVRPVIREAITLDPFLTRLENHAHDSRTCNLQDPALHHSQVLFHKPVNVEAVGESSELWTPSTQYQVNLRRKDGPYVYRRPFEDGDETAFDFLNEDRNTVTEWQMVNKALTVVFGPVETDFDVRRYAIFGENNWNHVQIHTTVDNQGAAAGVAVGVAGASSLTRALIVLIDEESRRLRILERRGTTISVLGSKSLPAGVTAPYTLDVIAFDDKIRASVYETSLEITRSDIREGRLALVHQGGGAFTDLIVEPLDAYRFSFQSSKFVNFEEHIQSFSGKVLDLPMGVAAPPGTVTETVDSMLSVTLNDISAVMMTDADPEERQYVFDKWVTALSLPLQTQVGEITLSRISTNGGTTLLLLESPEPIPMSKDVSLAMKRRVQVFLPAPVPITDTKIKRSPRFVSSIDFEGKTVTGYLKSDTDQIFRQGNKWLVRTEKVNEVLEYRIYKLNVKKTDATSFRISGKIMQTVLSGVDANMSPLTRNVEGMKENEIAIIDDAGELITKDFIQVDPIQYVDVPLRVLTNGNETQAIIIPMQENTNTNRILGSGTYRFDFSLDRARFRSQTQDNDSNYRANVSIFVEW